MRAGRCWLSQVQTRFCVAWPSPTAFAPPQLPCPTPLAQPACPAGTPACAWAAAAHGGTIYLLSLLLPTSLAGLEEGDRGVMETGRVAAASLLARLLAQPLHGPRVGLILGKMLPPGLVALIQVGSVRGALGAVWAWWAGR